MIRLETKVDALEKSIDGLRAEIRDIMAEMREFMLWGFGITFAGIFALIGFVLWDRRTALSPAVRKAKELEEEEEKIKRVLREYALHEPKLATVLKKVGLL